MSILSNPAHGAREAAEGYVAAILALVGDRDPLEILTETPERIARLVDGVDEEGLRTPEAPGKWSMAGVVQHLADAELVWAYRLRRVLADDRPRLSGFDQDRWAHRLDYAHADTGLALGVLRAVRPANLALVRKAEPGDLDRVGVHAERGDESVRGMIPLYAGHDLAHRNQLARIRAAVTVG